MKSEQDVQALSLNKRGKQLEELTSVDTDEFDDLKKKGLNLSPVWRIIKRNVLLITGVTTLAAATTLYSGLTSPHIYAGDFRFLVEPVTSDAKLTDPSAISRGVSPTTGGVDFPTLLQVLQSPGLMSEITKRIQLQYPNVSYNSITRNLVIQRIGTNLLDSTKLIQVGYYGEDPKKVEFILTEIAKGYLNYSLEERKIRIGGGVQFIDNQLPRLQQQVNALEGQLQVLQQRYKLSAPATDSAAISQQVREIGTQKLQTQRELRELKTLYTNLQRQLGLAPKAVIAASTLTENPNYQALLGQLKNVESQIAVESARFSEESPTIGKLREQQKNLSLLLNQEGQRILGSTAKDPQVQTFQNSVRLGLIKQMVDTTNQIQVLEVRNQAVTQVEASLNQQLQQFPVVTRRFNDLQRQLEIATKTLNQLLIQRETLQVEVAQKEVPWQIISPPTIQYDAAGNPIPAPRGIAKKLAMGVIGGFVLGLGAAALREKYRNVFYATEDIQNATELPLLGVIPLDESAKHPNYSAAAESIEETEANHSDASLFLEAFKSLYASIRFLACSPPVHSLVVCSPASGDGKTTIALHLARAAAVMGQRVLLVDANLRLPQIHTRLGLPNLQGLSNLLSKNLVSANDIIQRSPLEDNLFVLTSGQLLPNSTRLLASTQMQHLMEQFQAGFDLVIYDTPHLLGLTDANFLAAHSDGILMVVGVGKTNRSEVMQVLNKLKTWRLPILGIVANHVKENKNSSYGNHNHYEEENHQVHPAFVKTL